MAPVNVVRPRVSFADLQRAPEDGRRYELYDGEVFVVPAPFARHQRVVREISRLVDAYAQRMGGETLFSPIDIVFSEYDVIQPDVLYFRPECRDLIRQDEAIRSGPDLAVEVLSRSTADTDRGRKMQMLARYGVPEYWIVDPMRRMVEIYALGEGAYELRQSAGDADGVRSPTLPDLEFTADHLFARV